MKKGLRPQDDETICALASPPGESAIAVLRVSGKEAFSIVKSLCPFLPKLPLSHKVYYGTLLNTSTKEQVDEVLVSYFQEGRSFTGEESLEISCHGGTFIYSAILDNLLLSGARLAEPGEFSYRAFMNGRMDLVQAESILDMIQSRSSLAQQQALKGLKGSLSNRLRNIEEKILKLLAHLEASLDFSEENLGVLSVEQQKQLLTEIQAEVQVWLRGFKQSRINKEGFCVLLLGAPNAGKSSLFNCLIEEDQALISPYSGTTRDILSTRFILQQREFCLKDTAGLRSDPDFIEEQGIAKVMKEVEKSDLNVFLIEGILPPKAFQFFGLEKIKDSQNTFFVFSKSDKLTEKKDREIFLQQVETFIPKISEDSDRFIWLSSKSGEGVNSFKKKILECSHQRPGEIFLLSQRQFEAVRNISSFLSEAFLLLDREESEDLTAFELREALKTLHILLGTEYDEQVIQRVFKEFCIGK